ncbi:hypothetical protein ACFQ9X_45860 [Catenulispora yoronensis]
MRALLNAVAIGILLFLLFDVLSHAWEPVDSALSEQPHRVGSAIGYGLLLAAGLGIALCGLTRFDRWVAKRVSKGPGRPRRRSWTRAAGGRSWRGWRACRC